MNDNNMENIMNKINEMLSSNDIPDDLKNMVNSLKHSSSSNNSSSDHSSSSNSNNHSKDTSNIFSNINFNSQTGNDQKSNSSAPDIDINTMLKMKQVIDSMNANKDDPRTNLLLSLKPYLKESRQKKVEQYVKLFGIEKAFEAFNILGGESKK